MRLLTLLALLCILPAHASAQDISAQIDSVFNAQCLRGARIGMTAKLLGTGEVLYARNADTPMVPASNVKVVTLAAALETLSPTFSFETVFSHTGTWTGDTIDGDLVVTGKGDPHLVSEDLWLMAEALRKRGIRKITGRILLDDSYFDEAGFPPSWQVSRMRRAFEAPIGALSLNFNSITISIYPPSDPSEKPKAALSPATPYFSLLNTMRTVTKGGSYVTIDMKRRPDGGEVVVLGGRVRAGSKELTYYRNVAHPLTYFGVTFRDFLEKAGITVERGIAHGVSEGPVREMFSHSSRPLFYHLIDMAKFSNNFMAEQILKTIGAESYGPPGSTEKGVKRVYEYLDSLGISRDRYTLVDGSGLGKENRLSSSLIVELLEHGYRRWDSSPEFMVALALMGRDGSVEERFSSTERTIRVKTGTLTGVSALSGFYPLDSGEIVVFSMLFNDFSCNNDTIWQIQHRALMVFGKNGWKSGKSE